MVWERVREMAKSKRARARFSPTGSHPRGTCVGGLSSSLMTTCVLQGIDAAPPPRFTDASRSRERAYRENTWSQRGLSRPPPHAIHIGGKGE